ncbi:MAG: helix-turn-helix domain-containing protein [Pseudonocardia sp.]
MSSRRRPSALWLWSSPEASRALRTRDLAEILRTYRRLNSLSQERLAQLLGYDKTYISMIETRRRVINDVGTLRHIAHALGIPVHALGVTESDDATFAAMMQFAESVLSLAEIARKTGHASDAVNELWPLVARLEARSAEGFMERDSLFVLARARLSLGVALGTLLPDEKLTSAAKWTGQALIIAERLGEPDLTTHTLTMHGNELRKAGRVAAAIVRLQRAVVRSTDAGSRATACAMLARAAGEAGHAELFDVTMNDYRHQLDQAPDAGMLANEFTFREVQLRGLAATGRAALAARLLSQSDAPNAPVAPQWAVIERITIGDVLLAIDDPEGAEEALLAGLRGAESFRLPHQVQRAVRIATAGRLDAVTEAEHALIIRLAALGTDR